MVDITKCTNMVCPLRMNCYRFTATAGFWQSYSAFMPTYEVDRFMCAAQWKLDIEEVEVDGNK